MNLWNIFKRSALPVRIFIIVMFPTICYLWVSIFTFWESYEEYKKISQFESIIQSITEASNLLLLIQKERSHSFNIIFSQINKNKDQLITTRHSVDSKLKIFIDSGKDWSYDEASLFKTLQPFQEIEKIRNNIDNNVDIKIIENKFNHLISSIILYIKQLSLLGPSKILLPLQTLLSLEKSRNDLNILTIFLTNAISNKNSLKKQKIEEIITLNGNIRSFLDPSLFSSNTENTNLIKKIYQKSSWKIIHDTLLKVIDFPSKYPNEVIQNDNLSQFSLKKMEDISDLIEKQLIYIGFLVNIEKSQQINQILRTTIPMVIVLLSIITIMIFFSRNVMKELLHVITTLKSSSQIIQSQSSTIETSSQRVSESSEKTENVLNEAIEYINLMTEMIESTLDKSRETQSAADMVKKQVTSGNSIVKSMVKSMDKINESKEDLLKIKKIIASISKQTNVINEIVFKTQLLSVNAAIESVSAGDHGEGFAVVADEVAKLAQNSGEAAKNINQILFESQRKVESTINNIEERVNTGHDISLKVKDVFQKINHLVQEISEKSTKMNEASENQTNGVAQVIGAIENIGKASLKNSKESKAVVSESQGLKLESEKLSAISLQIQQLVEFTEGEYIEVNNSLSSSNKNR